MNPSPIEYSNGYAIVGQSLALPDASDLETFWNNLLAKKVSVDEVTKDRWNWEENFGIPSNGNQKTLCKWASLLSDFRYFDNDFFKISEKEARFLDPQIRILLQLAWNCFEDAGYNPDFFSGKRVGVFIGSCHNDFKIVQQTYSAYTVHGTPSSMLANRISNYLNISGPSLAVDTACSSSLTALHLGLQSLDHGDCDAILLGGVNYMPYELRITALSDLGVLSSTGHCRAFDDEADGIIIGEGAALLLIKRVEDAVKDGDHIYGIIKGTHINHGGRSRTVTSPNVFAQSNLLTEVYKKHNISPDTVSYIEAHGTGTSLGDPIEINALKRSFAELEKVFNVKLQEKSIPIGSVKPNVGHSEAAAGITGILKVLKILETDIVPPLSDFNNLNKRIKFDNSPFYIATDQQELKLNENTLKRVGISSFGIGGTNTHAIIESYPKIISRTSKRKKFIMLLSSQKLDSLTQMTSKLALFLERNSNISLESLEYTLRVGRKTFEHKLFLKVNSISDAIEQLYNFSKNQSLKKGSSYTETPLIKEPLDIGDKINLELLSSKWLEGYQIDWVSCYKDSDIQRIPAPGYVFMKFDMGLGNEELLTKKAERTEIIPEYYHRNLSNGKVMLSDIPDIPIDTLHSNSIAENKAKEKYVLNKSILPIEKEVLSLMELKNIIANLLFVNANSIDDNINFQDLGLDSITGIELVQTINKTLNKRFNATILYDAPSPFDLYKFINIESKQIQPVYLDTTETTINPGHLPKIAKPLNDEVNKNQILELAQILGAILFCQIGPREYNTNFSELGLDSITGIEFINHINKMFSIKIDATKLYDFTTLDSINEFINSARNFPKFQIEDASIVSDAELLNPSSSIVSDEKSVTEDTLIKFEKGQLTFDEVLNILIQK